MSEIEFTEADRKILVKVYVSLDRIVKEECAIADAFNDLSGDVYELERRIKALERRIERMERLLSHKTGKLAGNDFGAVFLDELGQEEQGGADELADD